MSSNESVKESPSRWRTEKTLKSGVEHPSDIRPKADDLYRVFKDTYIGPTGHMDNSY